MRRVKHDQTPETQPAASGAPPKPPKRTARGLEDQPPDDVPIHIPDPVVVSDLATALGKKPFVIIADLMELGGFFTKKDSVGFRIASKVVRKYGFRPQQIR